MTPQVIATPDLIALLQRSRRQRIILTWLVVLLWLALTGLVVKGHADTVESCRRGTEAARERAEIARTIRRGDLEAKAVARTRFDCGAKFYVF